MANVDLNTSDSVVLFAANTAIGLSNLTEEERVDFVSKQGVTVYYPLEQFSRFKISGCNHISMTELHKLETLAGLRQLCHNQSGGLCYGCAEIVDDFHHLCSRRHEMSMRAQLFRLNATDKRGRGYQDWLYSHRPRIPHTITKRKVEVAPNHTVRLSALQARLDFNNYRQGMHEAEYLIANLNSDAPGSSDFGIAIPFIRGRSPVASGQMLTFSLSVRNEDPDISVEVMTCFAGEDYYAANERGIMTSDRMNICVHLQYGMVGEEYYSLQVWLKVVHPRYPPRTFPICCEIAWTWFHPGFSQSVQQLLHTVPHQGTLDCNGVKLSAVPDSDMNPPNLTKGESLRDRVCNRLRFNHELLRPYLKAWDDLILEDHVETTGFRSRPFKLNVTAAGWDDAVDLNQLLGRETPITINNLPSRCFAELIGQSQSEEDYPPHARVVDLVSREAAEFAMDPADHWDGNHESLTPPSESMFLDVTVQTSQLHRLDLLGDLVRILHPSTPVKFLCKIEGTSRAPYGQTTLTLRLNVAAESTVAQWKRELDRNPFIHCQLIPPTGPVVQHLAGIYRTLLVEIGVQPTRSILRDENSNIIEQLQECSVSQDEIQTLVMGADELNAEGSKAKEKARESRRLVFQKAYRENWARIYKQLFRDGMWDPVKNYKKQWPDELPPHIGSNRQNLDDYQRPVFDAVQEGLRFVSCLAPPGTGKTYVTAVTTVLLHLCKPTARFLCVAPTNAAADVLARKILDYAQSFGHHFKPGEILRYVRLDYDSPDIRQIPQFTNVKYSNNGDEPSMKHISNSTLANTPIVIATIDLAIMDILNNAHTFGKDSTPVDLLVVDEAACIALPKLAMLLPIVARGQLLMMGDLLQLPAYITSDKLKAIAGDESAMEFFTRVMRSNNTGPVFMLRNNYRSREEILRGSNKEMYREQSLVALNNERLLARFDTLNQKSGGQLGTFVFPGMKNGKYSGPENKGFGVSFIHVNGKMVRYDNSWYNTEELFVVKEMVNRLVKCGVDPADIGIDCTYTTQAELLKQLLLPQIPMLTIGCSNTWQGSERDFMILSLVRSDPIRDCYAKCRDLGFLEDLRRLNVSLTRARLGNIIVGNALRAIHNDLLASTLRQVCTHEAWVSDPSMYPDQQELKISGHLSTQVAVPYYVHLKLCETWPEVDSSTSAAEYYDSRGEVGTPMTMDESLADAKNHFSASHGVPNYLYER